MCRVFKANKTILEDALSTNIHDWNEVALLTNIQALEYAQN